MNNKLLFKNKGVTVGRINSVVVPQVAINIQESLPLHNQRESGEMELLVTNLRVEIKRLRDCLYILSSIATANHELSIDRAGGK